MARCMSVLLPILLAACINTKMIYVTAFRNNMVYGF